jgi:hypothetical protein
MFLTNIELTGDNMAIYGNFKGTTKSGFQLGKSGVNLNSGERPSADISTGDIYFNTANATIDVFDNEWKNIGSTLTSLNVDNGTLIVDTANDTVSIGSTVSNEKLFVNGSLRLGTNPSIKHSGAFLDLKHANGSGTVIRVRDNTGNTDPVFKVFTSGNTNEAFKVQGGNVTLHNAYTMPVSDGTSGQVLTTDGNGAISFTTIAADPAGNTTEVQFNKDGNFSSTDAFTFDETTTTLQTGVVKGVLFEPITDYGAITESANMVIDYGDVSEPDNGTKGDFEFLLETHGITHDTFTVDGLPSAAQPGQMIFVEDDISGPTMAFSDGSNWRRLQDRAVIS